VATSTAPRFLSKLVTPGVSVYRPLTREPEMKSIRAQVPQFESPRQSQGARLPMSTLSGLYIHRHARTQAHAHHITSLLSRYVCMYLCM
jgi:hypothetical protein